MRQPLRLADLDHAHTLIDAAGGRAATAAKGWMPLDEVFVGAGIGI